jgi:tetratricopeptide (TPR) repeat protein
LSGDAHRPGSGPRADDFVLKWIGSRIGAAERRQVTMLACDGGCACKLSACDPDHAIESACLSRHVAAVTERYGGYCAARTGATLVACWGYPRTAEEDTRLAVGAALQIVAARPIELRVRCALDAGIIVAGTWPESLAGTAVETAAARMLAFAPLNAVVASDIVRRLSAASFEYEPWPAEAGHDEAGIWRVHGPRPGWRRSRPHRSVPLSGRERELDEIGNCWQRTLAGSTQIALICGEAGIGKSALVAGLREHVLGTGGNWVEAGCLPEMRHAGLAPVREALRELGGVTSQASADEPAIIDTFIAVLATAAAGRPIALIFEDVHWADEATLAFLVDLGQRLAGLAKVLLVCTGRGSMASTFPPDLVALDLTLDRLSDGDIVRLLAASDFAAALTPDTHQTIAERSDGIPLFSLELARLWGKSPPDELLAGPSSLKATLAARLDALGELKPLAQAAAVLGRDIDAGVLATTLEMETGSLARRLERLVENGIVARLAASPGAHYRFSHALLRDAAISSLPEARRRTLHAKVAEALARDGGGRRDVDPKVLAAHLWDANDFRGAFVWWRRAAERAADIASLHDAVANLERALAAGSRQREAFTETEEIEVLKLLGVQLTQLKGSAAPETITTYKRALGLMAKAPSACAQLRFDLMWGLDACHLVRGEVRQALTLGDALLAATAGQPSGERLMLAQRMHAVAKLLSGEIEQAIDLYGTALESYDQARHGVLRFAYASDQGAVAHAHLAWALAIAGRSDPARAHSRAALQLAGRFDHPHTSAHVVCVLATAAQILGDRGAASALAVSGKALANRHDFPYWSAWAGVVLGWTQGCRRPDTGARSIVEAISAYRSTGAEQALPYGYLLLGHTLLKANQPERAAEALEHAWMLGEQHQLMLYAAEILRLRARAEARLGSPRCRVMALLEQALEVARTQGALTFAARVERTITGLQGGDLRTGQAKSWFPADAHSRGNLRPATALSQPILR